MQQRLLPWNTAMLHSHALVVAGAEIIACTTCRFM